MRWTPPAQFSDRTPLNPLTDLNNYEIYVKESRQFTDVDPPSAIVAAVDPGTHQLTTTFNLANLGPFLQRGITYYVSMRSVAMDGLKSDFSAPAAFSF
jgi:hypothetical protein